MDVEFWPSGRVLDCSLPPIFRMFSKNHSYFYRFWGIWGDLDMAIFVWFCLRKSYQKSDRSNEFNGFHAEPSPTSDRLKARFAVGSVADLSPMSP